MVIITVYRKFGDHLTVKTETYVHLTLSFATCSCKVVDRIMMPAPVIVLLALLLIPSGDCRSVRPQVTSGFDDALSVVEFLTTSSINKRQILGTCSRSQVQNILADYPRDCSSQFQNLVVSNIVNEDAARVTATYRILCQPRCGNPIITFYNRCGLSRYSHVTRGVCTRDDTGRFCYEEFGTLLPNDRRVVSECISRRTFVCSTNCRNALITLRRDNGCCLNILNSTLFRGSGNTYSTTSYNLWSSCGVGTPGFCSLQTSSLSSAKATVFVKVLLLLTFVVMGLLLL